MRYYALQVGYGNDATAYIEFKLDHETTMPPPLPPNKPNAQAPLPPPNKPKPTPNYPVPKFNFKVEDLSHPGTQLFFDNVGLNPIKTLTEAVLASFVWLYTPDDHPTK